MSDVSPIPYSLGRERAGALGARKPAALSLLVPRTMFILGNAPSVNVACVVYWFRKLTAHEFISVQYCRELHEDIIE